VKETGERKGEGKGKGEEGEKRRMKAITLRAAVIQQQHGQLVGGPVDG